MKCARAILLVAFVAQAQFVMAEIDVHTNAVFTRFKSSYYIPLQSAGCYEDSARYLRWWTNNISCYDDSRSGGSIQEANENRLHRRGLSQWASGSEWWCDIAPDNNGGYTTATQVYTQLTNTFLAPGKLWDGAAYSDPGGWAAAHAGQFHWKVTGDITYPGHSTSASDTATRNFAATNIAAGYGYLGVDMFFPISSEMGWSNDIQTGISPGLREQTKNMQGSAPDGEHPGCGGAFGMAVINTRAEMDTNCNTTILDWGAVTPRMTYHSTVSGLSRLGQTLTFTWKADYHSMAYDMPDSFTTNSCATAFQMNPANSNAFHEDIVATNLQPNATFVVSEDGSNILTLVSSPTGTLSFNLFSVFKGAVWAQRKEVLKQIRYKRGVKPDTLEVIVPNVGEIEYSDVTSQTAWNAGDRGDTLISAMAASQAILHTNDVAIWAASIPTNHTFVIAEQSVVVDTNALLTLPTSALFHSEIGRQPEDGGSFTLNPPVFSWLCYESPNAFINSNAFRTYELKLGTNLAMSPLVWDLTVSNNFYNLLAPITNSDGSSFTNTVYWNVVYKDGAGNVISNHPVQTFTMASNAVQWNRSQYANTNFMMALMGTHPNLMFALTNRQALYAYFITHDTFTEYPGRKFRDTTNDALAIISQAWWNDPSVTNGCDPASAPASNRLRSEAFQLAEVGLTYQMTTNGNIVAANPGLMMEIIATNYVLHGYDKLDGYQAGDLPSSFALAYDWLYPLMTAQQRSNCVKFMEYEAQSFVCETWAYQATVSTDHTFSNPLLIKFGSSLREGESHARNGQVGLALCLAGYHESEVLRQLLPYFLSYYIAQFDPFQGDDGRGYNAVQNFSFNSGRQATGVALLMNSPVTQLLGLTNAPIYQHLIKGFSYYQPVGYGKGPELEPWSWGVQGGTPTAYVSDLQYSKYYDFALWFQSPYLMKQYVQQKAFNPGGNPVGENYIYQGGFSAFYYPNPGTNDWPTNVYLDAKRGWGMSLSAPPSDPASFTNGVGFVMQARPSGAGRLNATFTDGQVEMWAFGAHVTSGGSGNYEEHSMFANNPLFVDGIGYNNPLPPVADSWLSRFTVFTNATDFTAASADLTKSFARTNWNSQGYQNIQQFFYAQATNARPYIAGVTRSVIFPHKRYLVFYDNFRTTQPAHFQWKWNVWQTNCTVDTNGCAFSYAASNYYNGSNITVYVAHCTDPTQLQLTNLFAGGNLLGTNALNTSKMNPFTGENYTLQAQDGYYPDITYPYWSTAIWVQNKTAATNFHFMTVVFPVRWDDSNVPTITRISDNTVHVVQGTNDDIISFNESTPNTTFQFNVPDASFTNIPPPFVRYVRAHL